MCMHESVYRTDRHLCSDVAVIEGRDVDLRVRVGVSSSSIDDDIALPVVQILTSYFLGILSVVWRYV